MHLPRRNVEDGVPFIVSRLGGYATREKPLELDHGISLLAEADLEGHGFEDSVILSDEAES